MPIAHCTGTRKKRYLLRSGENVIFRRAPEVGSPLVSEDTRVGLGGNVEGNIAAAGSVHILGSLKGNVTAPSVFVGASGSVRGNITAKDITVEGRVDGTITADHAYFKRGCSIHADIRYIRAAIQEGSQIEARFHNTRSDGRICILSEGKKSSSDAVLVAPRDVTPRVRA